MNQRAQEVIGRLVPAITEVLDELDVTEAEYHAALEWLNRVGASSEAILLADVLHLSSHVVDHNHPPSEATASTVLGPFFRADRPDVDNPGRLCPEGEPGTPFVVTGQVRSAADAAPVVEATLDFWQSDDSGRYDVQNPGSQVNLRGRMMADSEGRYEVRSVLPRPYPVPTDGPTGELLAALGRHPWRPAHLHVMVEADGFEPLVTHLFVEGSDWLDEGDVVFGVKDSLVTPCPIDEDGVARADFDLQLTPIHER